MCGIGICVVVNAVAVMALHFDYKHANVRQIYWYKKRDRDSYMMIVG